MFSRLLLSFYDIFSADECQSVERTDSVLADGQQMIDGAVTFVPVETVTRITTILPAHITVPFDFGGDRSQLHHFNFFVRPDLGPEKMPAEIKSAEFSLANAAFQIQPSVEKK